MVLKLFTDMVEVLSIMLEIDLSSLVLLEISGRIVWSKMVVNWYLQVDLIYFHVPVLEFNISEGEIDIFHFLMSEKAYN